MAFLAPFIAKGAASSLGTGLTAGSVLGGGVGFKAGTSLLAPTLGSTLPTGSLLTAGGGSLLGGGGGLGGLGGLGGASGLLGGSGALLPKFASLGGKGGSLLSGTGGLGMLKPGADLAAFGGKTLSPGQLEYLRAASASTKPNLVSSNFLKSPVSPIDEFLTGNTQNLFPNAVEAPTKILGGGLNINAGPAGTLKLPTGPTTGLNAPLIGPETPITEGALSISKFAPPTIDPSKGFLSNALSLAKNPSMQGAMDYIETHPYASAAGAYGLYSALKPKPKGPEKDVALIRPYDFDYNPNAEAYATSPATDSSERLYFSPTFTAQTPYEAPGPEYKKAAEGGVMGLAVGGPVETMAAQNAVGANTGYPMAGINTPMYSNPMIQRPEAVNVISPSGDAGVSAYSGEPRFARGGLSDLGDYSDGGRLLKGPGDGVSDSIPASIGGRQPARLADGEFVIPARIVSEIGNGSTEAGARKLYAMMDRVQKARGKTVGKKKVAVNTRADKHLPA